MNDITPVFFDAVPIGAIYYMHYKALKPKPTRQSNRQTFTTYFDPDDEEKDRSPLFKSRQNYLIDMSNDEVN